MSQDADIDLILDGCGDSITAADGTQPCLYNVHDEVTGDNQQFAGQVLGMGYILIRTSAFPNLKERDALSVKRQEDSTAVDYIALSILRVQDGRISQVWLGKA